MCENLWEVVCLTLCIVIYSSINNLTWFLHFFLLRFKAAGPAQVYFILIILLLLLHDFP